MNAEGITDHSPSTAFLRDAASRGDFRALKERRTRIVATIGPSSSDPETLKAMAAAGLDVARVSFSHGSIDEAIERIRTIRKAIPGIAILADLPGPKVRTTPFGERGAFLEEGQELALAVAALAPSSDVLENSKLMIALFLATAAWCSALSRPEAIAFSLASLLQGLCMANPASPYRRAQ